MNSKYYTAEEEDSWKIRGRPSFLEGHMVLAIELAMPHIRHTIFGSGNRVIFACICRT